jgi:hypothetical protein
VPYADKEKEREYMRNYMREYRKRRPDYVAKKKEQDKARQQAKPVEQRRAETAKQKQRTLDIYGPEYGCWQAMRQRTGNPNNPSWEYYGGRGITMCEQWNDYEVFKADVGPRPSPKHTLDRIDPDGNYEPGNVRWATPWQQMNNRRISVKKCDDWNPWSEAA